jgi:hypothetical protein
MLSYDRSLKLVRTEEFGSLTSRPQLIAWRERDPPEPSLSAHHPLKCSADIVFLKTYWNCEKRSHVFHPVIWTWVRNVGRRTLHFQEDISNALRRRKYCYRQIIHVIIKSGVCIVRTFNCSFNGLLRVLFLKLSVGQSVKLLMVSPAQSFLTSRPCRDHDQVCYSLINM